MDVDRVVEQVSIECMEVWLGCRMAVVALDVEVEKGQGRSGRMRSEDGCTAVMCGGVEV